MVPIVAVDVVAPGASQYDAWTVDAAADAVASEVLARGGDGVVNC
ncbi:hypothetical protein [Haloarcula sp. JP-L23]